MGVNGGVVGMSGESEAGGGWAVCRKKGKYS